MFYSLSNASDKITVKLKRSSLRALTVTFYLKRKKADILNYKIWLQIGNVTQTVIYFVSPPQPAVFCLSARRKLAAPQLLSTQWVTALCSQNKTWQAVSEQVNLSGWVRPTVTHQDKHQSAECHFWWGHSQKTLFVGTVRERRADMAPTWASGSYDRWQLAWQVPLLPSVLLLKSAACLLTLSSEVKTAARVRARRVWCPTH